jgi:hypothetical protein
MINKTYQLDDPKIPVHIKLLFDDKCRLMKKSDNYFRSIENNSKFQFLFNTLHAIEMLEYTDESFNERWTLVTNQMLNGLVANKTYLFRIRNYKNLSLNIQGFEQIKLPIYDGYFFFRK